MNTKEEKKLKLEDDYKTAKAATLAFTIQYVLLLLIMIVTNKEAVLNIFKLAILFVFGFMLVGMLITTLGCKYQLEEL